MRAFPDLAIKGGNGTNPPRDPNKLELLYGAAALTARPLHTIVKGIFHGGSVTLIYGPPKGGKSFLATDLSLAITDETRSEWMGHKIVRHGPVLFVACEGHAGYWKRLRAYAKTHDDRFPENFILAIGRPRLIKADDGGLRLASDPSSIIEALEQAQADGFEPVCIVIDTVFRSFGVGNVNASQDMNIYLDAIATLTDPGYAVALVHHEIKSGGTPAGSVSLIGASDNIIHVWRENETSERRFWQVEMAKDDAETDPRAFTLKLVELGLDLDGEPASSLVVHDEGAAPDAMAKKKRGRPPSSTSDAAILADLLHENLVNLLADANEGEDRGFPELLQPVRAIERSRLRGTINRAGILVATPPNADKKARQRIADANDKSVQRGNTGKTPGVAALFSCTGSWEPDSSYV
jgi:hypothetical protein